MTTRCGLIAILGAPNAGKSTLVNRLAGSKVTIVSPKPRDSGCARW
jgi:GTP-binding protein Era